MRAWSLEPPIKPSPEAVRRLDNEREPAYRAMRLKLGLISESLAASKRGDIRRVEAIKRRIDRVDRDDWAEKKLTAVLNETRRLYCIEPAPALYEGEPYEWQTEFSTALAPGAASLGHDVAARTSRLDGRTVFVDAAAFESTPRLADFLIHAAVHFEQFTTGSATTTAVVDPEEVEASAAQAVFGPALGVSADEMTMVRAEAVILAAAWNVESDKAFSKWFANSGREAAHRRERPPIRHQGEIARLIDGWGDAEAKVKRGPEYWRRRLRDERAWRFLRRTVARLCADPASDLKGIWTLKNYAVERRFAVISFTTQINEYSACEQDVLADFVAAPDPVRYENLVRFVRSYRIRHLPYGLLLCMLDALGGIGLFVLFRNMKRKRREALRRRMDLEIWEAAKYKAPESCPPSSRAIGDALALLEKSPTGAPVARFIREHGITVEPILSSYAAGLYVSRDKAIYLSQHAGFMPIHFACIIAHEGLHAMQDLEWRMEPCIEKEHQAYFLHLAVYHELLRAGVASTEHLTMHQSYLRFCRQAVRMDFREFSETVLSGCLAARDVDMARRRGMAETPFKRLVCRYDAWRGARMAESIAQQFQSPSRFLRLFALARTARVHAEREEWQRAWIAQHGDELVCA